MRTLERTSAPAVDPVTLTEVKGHLLISDTASDAELALLITAAIEICEKYCCRAFITQKWKITYQYTEDCVSLPYGYVQSVETVKVYQDDGTTTTESATKYHVKAGEYGLLYLKNSETWTTSTRNYGSFEIIYKVGYGDAAANVPQGIKNGIMAQVAYMHEHRGDESADLSTVCNMARACLDTYRVESL